MTGDGAQMWWACTFDHRIADAYSANLFLVSWAEMAQSKPLSIVPSFRRSLLNIRRPSSYDPSLDDMYVPISALRPPRAQQPGGADHLISRIYHVTAEQLSLLQMLATSKSSSYKRTKLVFQCFFVEDSCQKCSRGK